MILINNSHHNCLREQAREKREGKKVKDEEKFQNNRVTRHPLKSNF